MLYDYSNPRIDDWMNEFENGRFGNSVDEFACEAIVVGTEGEWGGIHGAIVGITILCCGCNRVEGVVMGTVLSLVVQRLF